MSWGFDFTAETADEAKAKVDEQQHIPEKLREVLKEEIDAVVAEGKGKVYASQEEGILHVKSFGHHVALGTYGIGNGNYEVGYVKRPA